MVLGAGGSGATTGHTPIGCHGCGTPGERGVCVMATGLEATDCHSCLRPSVLLQPRPRSIRIDFDCRRVQPNVCPQGHHYPVKRRCVSRVNCINRIMFETPDSRPLEGKCWAIPSPSAKQPSAISPCRVSWSTPAVLILSAFLVPLTQEGRTIPKPRFNGQHHHPGPLSPIPSSSIAILSAYIRALTKTHPSKFI
jgi:hypothetical protein